MENNSIITLSKTSSIKASQVVPGYPAHGVVIDGTTAKFEQTNNQNANAAFLFTGLKQTNEPGNIHLNWNNLGIPGFNSNLGLFNYSTNKFDYYLAYGVTYVQVNNLKDYINSNGELQIVVWLNLALGTLETLDLNY